MVKEKPERKARWVRQSWLPARVSTHGPGIAREQTPEMLQRCKAGIFVLPSVFEVIEKYKNTKIQNNITSTEYCSGRQEPEYRVKVAVRNKAIIRNRKDSHQGGSEPAPSPRAMARFGCTCSVYSVLSRTMWLCG